MSIAAARRWTPTHPCPICGGHDRMERGAGRRCYGFLSDDEQYAHCSREELAGAIGISAGSETYGHRLIGPCRCGAVHGESVRTEHTYVNGNGQRPKIVATYDYLGINGDVLYQVVRFDPKSFRQRRPDGTGGWDWKLTDVPRVLYRLPALLAAPKDAVITIVEGEKDADALTALGILATCNPGGAGKWRRDYGEALAGHPVVILPDKDQIGRQHAQAVKAALVGFSPAVAVVDLPGDGKDVSDWIAAGGDRAALDHLIADALRPPPPRYRILTWGDLEDAPEIAYLIDGMVPRGCFAALVGETGKGKTFLALDMAARIGLAGEQVLYVVAEGQYGIKVRTKAWQQFYNGGERVPNVFFLPEPIYPTVEEVMADLFASMATVGCSKPVLIVFDTLSMNFVGNENDTPDMKLYVDAVTALRIKTGACVLPIHHTGWDASRMGGNRKLQNALDVEMRVEQDELGTISLSCTKMRDAEKWAPRYFRLHPVGGTDSCVIVPTRAEPQPESSLSFDQRAVLDYLATRGTHGAGFNELSRQSGVSRRPTLSDVLKHLQTSGNIVVRGAVGSTERRYFHRDATQFRTGSDTSSEPVPNQFQNTGAGGVSTRGGTGSDTGSKAVQGGILPPKGGGTPLESEPVPSPNRWHSGTDGDELGEEF